MFVLIFWLVWSALLVVFLVRNQMVYNYQQRLLKLVSAGAQRDILSGQQWRWRYDVLRSVEYNEMVLKFWRSFDSFYPDKSFIE